MSINEKLTRNLYTVVTEDGTTRGKFDKLTRKDFSSKDAFNAYSLKLSFASFEMGKALSEEDDRAEEAGRHRNLAIAHINDAFKLLAAEIKLNGTQEAIASAFEAGPVKKATMRKWLASGAFARIKTNYADASRTLNMKNIPSLQRLVECLASDIINSRTSLAVVQCEKVSEKIAAAEKAKAEAEAKAAEEKPEEKPEEK